MKTKILLCALLLGASGADSTLTTPVKAATATVAEQKAFAKIYAAADRAFLTKDIQFFKSRTAPKFSRQSNSGKILNREAYLKNLEQTFQGAEIKKIKTTIANLKIQAKEAYVSEISFSDFVIPDLQGKSHHVIVRGRATKKWVLTRMGWQMITLRELETRLTVDGREIPQN